MIHENIDPIGIAYIGLDKIATALVRNGANVNAVQGEGLHRWTPLNSALWSGKFVDVILKRVKI